MLNPVTFVEFLGESGIDFFTGVPDSLLKDFCAAVDELLPHKNHVITANEGGAVALAAGNHLATGKIPLVYLQNSGLGNTINPLLSLVDKEVYGIPMLLMVGWRGEPGISDEPQHEKQGMVTQSLLASLSIPYAVLPKEFDESKSVVGDAVSWSRENNSPFVILVRKGTFSAYISEKLKHENNQHQRMLREEALEIILQSSSKNTVFVASTGKISRELFELREKRSESHGHDFLTVGSMGHASQIACGIAEQISNKPIICLDGDGAALMHLGGLATIAGRSSKNFIHIIFNNGVHESVGGQPITGKGIDFVTVAKGLGYADAMQVSCAKTLGLALVNSLSSVGPVLIDCIIRSGSRSNLGRPTVTPKKNKEAFVEFLRK